MNLDGLRRWLIERQWEQRLDNARMAQQLGIHPQLWSKIRTGKRTLSAASALEALMRWPEAFSTLTTDPPRGRSA